MAGALSALIAGFTAVVIVAVMFGAMGVLGITINLFNIVASVLIIGICVDYGIFMLDPTGHVSSWNLGAARR